MPQKRSQLALAVRDKALVKFTRPFEDGSVNGYVMDIGPEFFLVALVEDASRFNGFQCFRLSDVRELEVPSRYSAFAEAALKKRGRRMPKRPPVDVRNLQRLITTANRAFPLVTIHRERADADVCHIGRVVHLSRDRVSLIEIGPNALWDDKPETYRLREITRVDFGCEYEESLHLVGGRATARKAGRR
jgi:hypothetical protein